MNVSEYAGLDATALAAAIRGGDVSAEEAYAAAVAAVEAVNPTINAVADGPWERPLEHTARGLVLGVDDRSARALGRVRREA